MSMCGICWFDGRALADEIDDLRQRVKEFEARERLERDRFIRVLTTMRKALVLNGSRLTDDAINAYEELKLSVANDPAGMPRYKYPETFCSQCGGEFGPGNEGFSHCENHRHLPRLG